MYDPDTKNFEDVKKPLSKIAKEVPDGTWSNMDAGGFGGTS